MYIVIIFFFKQKTAYEMRISDWSSDVCSSDLRLTISDSAMKAVIEGYAREAGVRQLEKQLGKLVRKAVVQLLEDSQAVLKITPKDLESYLGKPVFRSEQRAEERSVGNECVSTGRSRRSPFH